MWDTLSAYWQSIRNINIGPQNLFEILILTVLIYLIIGWLKNSRVGFLMLGLIAVFLFYILASLFNLTVILYLFNELFGSVVIAAVVIFQPDIRAMLERLGTWKGIFSGSKKKDYDARIVEELVTACFSMGRVKTGALIVIERKLPLSEYIANGIKIDAEISGALLINIFEKNTPLHDGAVILQNGRLAAATCYLPMSSNSEINKSFGTRHRSAIGISEVTDSLSIVVSEETGKVSLAQGGKLQHDLNRDQLREALQVLKQEDAEKTNTFRWVRDARSFRPYPEKVKKAEAEIQKEEAGYEEK